MFGNSIRIGRPFGIAINVDPSLVIAFGLITWSLGQYYFPDHHATWSSGVYWGIAVLTSLLFFTSVLAHELAHSLVARRFGIGVRDITLFIFGGAASMEREPRRPREEFLVALAGPVSSLALAGVFGLLWWLSNGSDGPVHALTGWLAGVNLALTVFNLIPGFPLDGGRVLRAVAWALTGSLRTATRIASGVGRAVAYGFIFWGVWQLFSGNWMNGLWIAFIGWFLTHAIEVEWKGSLRELLAGHVAREVMVTDCPRLARRQTLDVVVETAVLPSGRRCLPVVEDERVFGLLTVERIRAIPRERWPFTRVEDVMLPRAAVAPLGPDDDLMLVIERMNAEEVDQLPVMNGDRLAGVVTREHLSRFVQLHVELNEPERAA